MYLVSMSINRALNPLLTGFLCSLPHLINFMKELLIFKIALYNNVYVDWLFKRILQPMGTSWEGNGPLGKCFWLSFSGRREPLNHRPRCSGNLLSLWDGLGHGTKSKASGIQFRLGHHGQLWTGTSNGRDWKWELWQCLNATAPGLEVFLGWNREAVQSLTGRGTTLARKSCCSRHHHSFRRQQTPQQHTSYFRLSVSELLTHLRTLFLQRSFWPFKVGRPGEKQRHAV